MAKVTKRSVDALIATSRPVFLWDDALIGFGVKALPSGRKRYIVKYRTAGGGRSAPQRWLQLGSHGQLTADQARAMAQQALAAIARGEDPQADKLGKRAAAKLSDVWLRFELEHLPLRKAQTRYDYTNLWRGLIEPKLGKLAIDALSESDIDRLHKSMAATPYQANRALALLSRLTSLAELWGLRPPGTNPCRQIQRFKERPRQRFLSAAEVETLGQTLRQMTLEGTLSCSAANAVRMLLLTGARLNEILAAEWAWVDIPSRVLALPDSKTGAKPLFLSREAIQILEWQRGKSGASRYIFPGTGAGGRMINLRKPWVRICEHADLQGVRLHDLRHTVASVAVGQGASLPVIGKLLGHTQPQTTQRYAHVDTNPALDAIDLIGRSIGSSLL